MDFPFLAVVMINVFLSAWNGLMKLISSFSVSLRLRYVAKLAVLLCARLYSSKSCCKILIKLKIIHHKTLLLEPLPSTPCCHGDETVSMATVALHMFKCILIKFKQMSLSPGYCFIKSL